MEKNAISKNAPTSKERPKLDLESVTFPKCLTGHQILYIKIALIVVLIGMGLTKTIPRVISMSPSWVKYLFGVYILYWSFPQICFFVINRMRKMEVKTDAANARHNDGIQDAGK